MDLLVIGGTRFVGRHLVRSALSGGHRVTLLHRQGIDPFPEAEHLHADRGGDLAVLADRRFDATVDVCAYWPRQVRTLGEALAEDRSGHYELVSSVSAYAGTDAAGADESAALADRAPGHGCDPDSWPMTDRTYGPLKVACERAAAHRFARLTVVRPTYVVGPYDPTHRFCWWLDRLSRGGEVLAPGPHDAPVQLVDAADLGKWMVGLADGGITGAYHACSTEPGWTFGELLEAIAGSVAPAGTRLRWVDGEWLREQGVDESDLPLWSEGRHDSVMALDPAAGRRTGLGSRAAAETIRDTWRWMQGSDFRSGRRRLDAGRETELLSRAPG
ncbi:MAG: NAD-dependent epimerase/dehydratase family protein [Nocardioidaceae bacterium]|nr:NAD-dependent epimerase/dehydratase family protein [Nocardioidaceae bacterium]